MRLRTVGFAISVLALAHNSWAADPQAYTVSITPTGSGNVDPVLQSTSQLVGLRDKVPVPPFALIERARNDIVRLQTALDGFGYYQNKVIITIAGRALDDTDLPSALDQTPLGNPVAVQVVIDKGPLYYLGQVLVQGDIPDADRAHLLVRRGDPAEAGAVLDAQAKMLGDLQEEGYALAAVEAPVAFADDANHVVNVTYKVTTGPRARIGIISFKGLKDVDASFVRRALAVKSGDPYRPSKIEAARQALASLGVFSGVTVHAAQQLSADGRLPLEFDVEERPLHAVSLAGTYSTDLGINLSATWSHRNLFGQAEQLNVTAAGTGLGSSSAGLGYNLSAQFLKPHFGQTDQILEFDIAAVKQQLDAYDQTAQTASGYLRRKFSPLWSGSVGLSLANDSITQEGSDRLYQLISAPTTVSYDSTGLTDLFHDPVAGARASVAVTPTQAFGANSVPFLALQASASKYFDLGRDGRSVVALREAEARVLGRRPHRER